MLKAIGTLLAVAVLATGTASAQLTTAAPKPQGGALGQKAVPDTRCPPFTREVMLGSIKATTSNSNFAAGFNNSATFAKQWRAYAALLNALDPRIIDLRLRIVSLKGGAGGRPGAPGERIGEPTDILWAGSTAAGLGPAVTGNQSYWTMNGGEWRYLHAEMAYVYADGAQTSLTCTFTDAPFTIQNQGSVPTLMTYTNGAVVKVTPAG